MLIIEIVIALVIFFVVLPLAAELCFALILHMIVYSKEYLIAALIIIAVLGLVSLAQRLQGTRWDNLVGNTIGILVFGACGAALIYDRFVLKKRK